MTAAQPSPAERRQTGSDGVIKLAVMAVGGQGGGVLIGWIETLARAQGYACQATSVAGVSQRTGATIYYIEMAEAGPRQPVFALSPGEGDVDILIAAEFMEAGRAILRGFVTPDRTTLIASSHRVLAVSEKSVPGNGVASSSDVHQAAEEASASFIAFDMERLAVENGSVVSAVLFGALAGSGRLPFPSKAFKEAIRSGGTGVEASLRAFNAGFESCLAGNGKSAAAADPSPPEPDMEGPRNLRNRWAELAREVEGLPESARPLAMAGLRRVVDYMDLDYGEEYLGHLSRFADLDPGTDDHALTKAASKYIANAMAYDDVIRVADRKTRRSRTSRIAIDAGRSVDDPLPVTEFLRPRNKEIVGLLPAGLGRRVERDAGAMAWIGRRFGRGRRLRSDRLGPFVALYLLGGLKRYRRRTHRHAVEQEQQERWLSRALQTSAGDPALATEILRCRRLVKGYSGTHERGLSKFDRVLELATRISNRRDADAADWVRRLREAALAEEGSQELERLARAIERL